MRLHLHETPATGASVHRQWVRGRQGQGEALAVAAHGPGLLVPALE